MGKWSAVVDSFNVGFVFVVVILLTSRMEAALRGNDKQALYLLASIGISYSFYLFFFDLVPLMIKKLSRKLDADAELPVKLLTPIVVLSLVNLVPLESG